MFGRLAVARGVLVLNDPDGLALAHAAAREGEIMLSRAMTLHEGKGIILDEDGGRTGSHLFLHNDPGSVLFGFDSDLCIGW